MKLSIRKAGTTGAAGVCFAFFINLAYADDALLNPAESLPSGDPLEVSTITDITTVTAETITPPSQGRIVPVRFDSPVALDEGQRAPTLIAPVPSPEALTGELPEVAEPTLEVHVLAREEDIDSYQALLREMESEYGIWDITLSEELMALGEALQDQGKHQEALEVFLRAAHINRVNYGLNSVEQLEPLEKLVETYLALDDWKEADRRQYYSYYIQSRAYAPDDPRLIPALDKLARWNLMTFQEDAQEGPLYRLLDAYWLYKAAASLVTLHFGANDPRYVGYLEEMTETAYKLALYGTQGEIDREVVRKVQERLESQGVDVGPISSVSGFVEGERALRDIYELYSSPRMSNLDNVEWQRVQALAELGDWYLMFNRRQAALRVYRDVNDMLQQIGPDAAERFFHQVIALQGYQADGIDPALAGTTQDMYQGYIDITLDVSQYGRASNLQLAGLEPERGQELAADVLRRARLIHFRPRFDDGNPVKAEGVRLRFPFWYIVENSGRGSGAEAAAAETTTVALP